MKQRFPCFMNDLPMKKRNRNEEKKRKREENVMDNNALLIGEVCNLIYADRIPSIPELPCEPDEAPEDAEERYQNHIEFLIDQEREK